MKEIWKTVENYEGLYEVSNMGRVRSLNYNHTGQTRILKPGKNKLGYLSVYLYKDGERKPLSLHRLVANAFLSNSQNLPCVNHRDECPLNNHVSNLEFCSVQYNNCYGSVLKRKAVKLKNGPCSKPVLQYDRQGHFVKQWPSAREIERQLGYSQSAISACCRGELKTAYGFVWTYV